MQKVGSASKHATKSLKGISVFYLFFNQNDLFAQCRTERLSVITSGIQKTNVLWSYCFDVSMSCRGQFVMVWCMSKPIRYKDIKMTSIFGSVALLWRNAKCKCKYKFANKCAQANIHNSKWLILGFTLHFAFHQSRATDPLLRWRYIPIYKKILQSQNRYIFFSLYLLNCSNEPIESM